MFLTQMPEMAFQTSYHQKYFQRAEDHVGYMFASDRPTQSSRMRQFIQQRYVGQDIYLLLKIFLCIALGYNALQGRILGSFYTTAPVKLFCASWSSMYFFTAKLLIIISARVFPEAQTPKL